MTQTAISFAASHNDCRSFDNPHWIIAAFEYGRIIAERVGIFAIALICHDLPHALVEMHDVHEILEWSIYISILTYCG